MKVLILFLFLLTCLCLGIGITSRTFGQDLDPRYYCLYKDQYPFSELCNRQTIHGIIDDAVKLANQKDAEFCHVFSNTSYCQAKCQIDESICVLGRPDPDFNDTGTED